MTEDTEATWTPPGAGSWICDRSHTSPGPTRLYRRMVEEHTEPAYRRVMRRYGGAVGSVDLKFVNGAMYRRIVPLLAPDKDKGTVPPKPLLWLVTRLHPEFRRRERIAAAVLRDKTFLDEIRTWSQTERDRWIDRNRALQAVDPHLLSDDELAEHLGTLDETLVAGWTRHHELHGADLGPIGDLLAHALRWDLDTSEVMSLLRGSSPATTDAARHGATIADALRAAGFDPATLTSIEQIRAAPAASRALDDYLELFGWRLISDYDIEGLTLHEIPSAVVAIVRAAAADRSDDASLATTPTSLDDTEPLDLERQLAAQAADPELFAELLSSAREAYGVRDDNGPLTWAWPAGLTRRAYLEAADRLATRGEIDDPAHVFELDLDELAAALAGTATPTTDELAQRAAQRRWERTLHAPDELGPPAVEPDLAPLPPAMRRVMGIILAASTMLEPEERHGRGVRLSGLGVGVERYRGIARVADDAAAAIEALRPGEVLVTPWTAPSFNAVFAIAGGVVVQEGGLLCHAAVMARELGIPAVVGCTDAMAEISSGDLVEIDPAEGRVSVVGAAAS